MQSYAENAAKKRGEARLNKRKRDKRRRKMKRAGNGGRWAEKQARGRDTREQMERRRMEEKHGKG